MSKTTEENILHGDPHLKNFPEDLTLGKAFFQCMTANRKYTAQYTPETNSSDTFGTVLEKSIRTALKMQSMGIKKNDIIAVCSYNHETSNVPFIAGQLIGCQVACFDPGLSQSEMNHLTKLVEPKLMFTVPESVPMIEKAIKLNDIEILIVDFTDETTNIKFSEFLNSNPQEKSFTPVKGSNKDVAVILFSSGTTGSPKAICLSHFALLPEEFHLPTIGEEDLQPKWIVGMLSASLIWISSITCLIRAILLSYALVLIPKFIPKDFWELLEKYRVNFIICTPAIAHSILDSKPTDRVIDVSSFIYMTLAGSSASSSLRQALHATFPKATITVAYGITETGIIAIFNETPKDNKLRQAKPLSCGIILRGVSIKIVDTTTGNTLGSNQTGEIRVKSEAIMTGYYKMPKTEGFDDEGWYRTGDLGYYDEDKCIYVVDRLKEMLKYRGWRIAPSTLENVMLAHPKVKDVMILGILDEKDGDHLLAIVVLKENNTVPAKDLEDFFNKQVTDNEKLRAGVRIVEDLPRTCSGKIARNTVREMVRNNKL